MCGNKLHGGTIHIDPSSFLLANNCSFLLTKLLTVSDETDYLIVSSYIVSPGGKQEHRNGPSLETENV